jgi:sugar transferase (PEP-CTERM/EpsH1 system associated)
VSDLRILWVKIGGLWPLDRGGRLRSFHLISELSRRHRMTVLTTHSGDSDPHGLATALPACQRITSLPHDMPKKESTAFARALVRSWFSPLPVDLWKAQAAALRAETDCLMKAGQVDLCVSDFLASAPNVPWGGPVPVLLFAHNVEHVIWKRLAETERRAWRRALLALEWRKMRRWEAATCARASLTVAVSEPDRALLAALAPGARVAASSTGVDTSYFRGNGIPEVPTRLVFTGSMDWYPNEDAILYFIDAILPAIRREVPGITLTVAGRQPSPRLRAVAERAGVRVTGTVTDVRPYIAEAAVYVVPLRVGGGTRLKIFEALAMEKAVLSTPTGVEGLPLTPGQHFILAEDPANFAAAAVKLLREPGARRALGANGRRLVEARYSWAQVAEEFDTYLQQAVLRPSTSP